MAEKEEVPPITFEIHVGTGGGVRVDPKEFFEDPEVKRKIELLRQMDIVGKKLNFQKPSQENSD